MGRPVELLGCLVAWWMGHRHSKLKVKFKVACQFNTLHMNVEQCVALTPLPRMIIISPFNSCRSDGGAGVEGAGGPHSCFDLYFFNY